jgi:hypothetical protein
MAATALRGGGMISPWAVWLPIGFGMIFIGGIVMLVVVQGRRARNRAMTGPRSDQRGGVVSGPPPGPPAGDRELDAENAAFWLHLAPGDQVEISDVVAFADALDAGVGSIHGADYKIAQVTFAEGERGATTVLALLDDARQPLLLVADVAQGAVELRLFHRPVGAPGGNRADLLDAGAFWLFQSPANPDDFAPSDLAFTRDIIQDGKGPEGDVEVRFDLDGVGERLLRAASRPRGPDGDVFALRIVSWHAATTATDPWLMVLERAGSAPLGGHIELWQGCDVRPADLAVTPGAFVGVDLGH